jgi:hypothetical protein
VSIPPPQFFNAEAPPRRTRQAAEGKVEETELAVYEHGAEAADEVADELRDGIRNMVVCELDPETVWNLRWEDYGQDLPAAGFPTIMEADILVGDSLFLGLDGEQQRALLSDESTQTAVKRGDGILPAIRVKRTRGALATVDELAAVLTSALGQRAWKRLLVAGTRLRGALYSRRGSLIEPWDSYCQRARSFSRR